MMGDCCPASNTINSSCRRDRPESSGLHRTLHSRLDPRSSAILTDSYRLVAAVTAMPTRGRDCLSFVATRS
jgi:hypothetical protein